ncbi:MAG: efflux RND transporter permease subunit [Deltaproteobacteria bacterium]|nr:efflux RND transporter permease subunit [Deltaproteobacteria bacterium]
MELAAAIMESVSVRYRPIMMTALSDVAGMLPLALEMAVGSERFSPLATAVIGGVLAATLLTLVVIPVIFRLLER